MGSRASLPRKEIARRSSAGSLGVSAGASVVARRVNSRRDQKAV